MMAMRRTLALAVATLVIGEILSWLLWPLYSVRPWPWYLAIPAGIVAGVFLFWAMLSMKDQE